MMRIRKLYQATENRENADELEKSGPIFCENAPWLGSGYYFWDSFIENAHWWGKVHYHDRYFIAETGCDANSEELFDLVGNVENLSLLKAAADLIKLHTGKEVTVDLVLEYLKEKTSFNYKAIRAYPEKSRVLGQGDLLYFRNKRSYIDVVPPIQICVFDKSFLKMAYKVVFPLEYATDYTV